MRRLIIASAFAALLIFADFPTRRPLPGHSRVTLRIKDEAGRATGLRLRVTNEQGETYAPLGHLPRPDMAAKSTNDVILGDDSTSPREVHALIYDGAQIDLPAGRYSFAARKGLEYELITHRADVSTAPDQTVTLPLRRIADFEARGWYPGDTHMHYPDQHSIRYQMECEGLRVCSLLLLKSGYKDARGNDGHFWNVEQFTGRLSPVSDSRHFVKVGEEFRHGLLAHLIFQNLKQIVWPVSVGQLRENGAGGFDWPLMLHGADDVRAQGGLVTWAHWPYPSMEAPMDIALGRIDSLDILTTGNPFEHHPILVDIYKMHGPRAYSTPPIEMYYHYLNCGFRVAASSGSDKMAANPPMGSARTYVKTDGPLSYDSWIEGIRRGRTFISTYPLLEFTVDGREPGDTVKVNTGTARLRVKARSISLEPYDVLEIIHNGRVVRTVKPSGPHHEARIDDTIETDRGGWIAARAHGPKMLPYGATWWQMPVFGHTSPVYLEMPGRPARARESAQLLLEQIGYLERWAESRARFPTQENKTEALALILQATSIYQKLIDRE